jgi:hypothetical protein
MKINDLFILLTGNQTKICILRHFISDIINAVLLVWRIHHHRGKQTTSLSDLRLLPRSKRDFSSFGILRDHDLWFRADIFEQYTRPIFKVESFFLDCLTLKYFGG